MTTQKVKWRSFKLFNLNEVALVIKHGWLKLIRIYKWWWENDERISIYWLVFAFCGRTGFSYDHVATSINVYSIIKRFWKPLHKKINQSNIRSW